MAPAAATAPQTSDDLNALAAKLAASRQQRQQAATDLQRWAGELAGSKSAQAVGEIDRLNGFIARLDTDIERQQADVDTLAELLKTDDEREAEQAAGQLRQEQTARRDELTAQLASLLAAFNLQSAQLREQWQTIRALLHEQYQLADALGDLPGCSLGAHFPAWNIDFYRMGANQYGYLQIDRERIGLNQPMPKAK